MNGSELEILLKQFKNETNIPPEDIVHLKRKDINIFSSVFRNLMAHRDPRSYSILGSTELVKPSRTLQKWNIAYIHQFKKKRTEFPSIKEYKLFKTSMLFYYEYSQYKEVFSELVMHLGREKIIEIAKDLVRKMVIEYLDNLPPREAIEFLKNKIENIVDLSAIKVELKEDLKNILSSMLDSENNMDLAQEIKESIMKIYNNCEDEDYNIIFLKLLDILIENSDKTLNLVEKLQFFKNLIFLKDITLKDMDKFYEFLENSDLKAIFGRQIEDDI